MKIILENNNDGTSNGFIVTKEKIVIVNHDQMTSFNNNKEGHRMVDILLNGALNGESYEDVQKKMKEV